MRTKAPRRGHKPVEPAPPDFQPVAGVVMRGGSGEGDGEADGAGEGCGAGCAGLKGAFLGRLAYWLNDWPGAPRICS